MTPRPYPGTRLTTFAEVDEALGAAAELRKVSESRFVEALSGFWMDLPPVFGDPWSHEYRRHWQSVYEWLAGKKYHVSNEFFDFDVEYHSLHPYPFCTEDFQAVSRQLMGIGNIIRTLALPPKASILEMGAGWGNTSLFLAQMGYDVTVVDINPKYGELINRRAEKLGVRVDFQCISFEMANELNRRFDCVLFFESFHHAHEHWKLLQLMPSLMEPAGILALAGEPINDNLSYDWGLNPAGEALWQIRTHGWFELVFKESYLVRTLNRYGFEVEKNELAGNPVGTTYVCRLLQ